MHLLHQNTQFTRYPLRYGMGKFLKSWNHVIALAHPHFETGSGILLSRLRKTGKHGVTVVWTACDEGSDKTGCVSETAHR